MNEYHSFLLEEAKETLDNKLFKFCFPLARLRMFWLYEELERHSYESEQEKNLLVNQKADLQQEVDLYKDFVYERNQQIKHLQTVLAEKDKQIAKLKEDIDIYDGLYVDKSNEATRLADRLECMQEKILEGAEQAMVAATTLLELAEETHRGKDSCEFVGDDCQRSWEEECYICCPGGCE